MIAELRTAIEDRVRSRNPEILWYFITHHADYYHTHIKPKLNCVDGVYGDYWAVMRHFLQVQ